MKKVKIALFMEKKHALLKNMTSQNSNKWTKRACETGLENQVVKQNQEKELKVGSRLVVNMMAHLALNSRGKKQNQNALLLLKEEACLKKREIQRLEERERKILIRTEEASRKTSLPTHKEKRKKASRKIVL